MPAPKLVSLDAYGTLIEPKRDVGAIYRSVFYKHFPTIEENQLQSALFLSSLSRAMKAISRSHPCYGGATNLPCAEWWRRVIRETYVAMNSHIPQLKAEQVDSSLDSMFHDLYYGVFSAVSEWKVRDQALDTLEALRQWKATRDPDLKVGVISNFDDRLPLLLKGPLSVRHCLRLSV